jgi:hypothetical protein
MSALKQLLKQNSIAQSSLCKPLGVSTATVNLFVNHGQRPKRTLSNSSLYLLRFWKQKELQQIKFNKH